MSMARGALTPNEKKQFSYKDMSTEDESILSDPNIWGPPFWDMLFTFAFHLPQQHVAIMVDMFALLEKVLPCQSCRRTCAVFRKQLPPLTSLRVTNTKAAEWLWTIHDMVNQKLDKTAISYDKLVLKHKYITSLAHPMNVIDILHIMSRTVRLKYVAEFATVMQKAAKLCPGMEKLSEALQTSDITEANLPTTLFEAHNFLRVQYGMAVVDRGVFDSGWRAPN